MLPLRPRARRVFSGQAKTARVPFSDASPAAKGRGGPLRRCAQKTALCTSCGDSRGFWKEHDPPGTRAQPSALFPSAMARSFFRLSGTSADYPAPWLVARTTVSPRGASGGSSPTPVDATEAASEARSWSPRLSPRPVWACSGWQETFSAASRRSGRVLESTLGERAHVNQWTCFQHN